ncbi:hypothetical protein PRIC2_010831 [Phytophthora ramorum]
MEREEATCRLRGYVMSESDDMEAEDKDLDRALGHRIWCLVLDFVLLADGLTRAVITEHNSGRHVNPSVDGWRLFHYFRPVPMPQRSMEERGNVWYDLSMAVPSNGGSTVVIISVDGWERAPHFVCQLVAVFMAPFLVWHKRLGHDHSGVWIVRGH